MKNRLIKLIIFILVLSIGAVAGMFLRHNQSTWVLIKKPFVKLEDNLENKWSEDFSLASIKSSIDSTIQKIYYYKSKSNSQNL